MPSRRSWREHSSRRKAGGPGTELTPPRRCADPESDVSQRTRNRWSKPAAESRHGQKYTFDEALREAQNVLGGEPGVVDVDDKAGAIVVHVSDQGAGGRIVDKHDDVYHSWPLKTKRASATGILTVYARRSDAQRYRLAAMKRETKGLAIGLSAFIGSIALVYGIL